VTREGAMGPWEGAHALSVPEDEKGSGLLGGGHGRCGGAAVWARGEMRAP
jgi:hypothetical protein